MRNRIRNLVQWLVAPRRRIKQLRIDLRKVREYNLALAMENHNREAGLEGLGEKLIGQILKQGMFSVNYPDPDESHIFVWSSIAEEQLECVVAEFLNQK